MKNTTKTEIKLKPRKGMQSIKCPLCKHRFQAQIILTGVMSDGNGCEHYYAASNTDDGLVFSNPPVPLGQV